MSTVRKHSQEPDQDPLDPLSLDGLDDLLNGMIDQVFEPETSFNHTDILDFSVDAEREERQENAEDSKEYRTRLHAILDFSVPEQAPIQMSSSNISSSTTISSSKSYYAPMVTIQDSTSPLFGADSDSSPAFSSLNSIIAPDNAATDSEAYSIDYSAEYAKNLELELKLLESQLAHKNSELKSSYSRVKFLETLLISQDNQLSFLPELLKRSVDATRYETELADLRENLKDLSEQLTSAQETMNLLRANWLGKLSLWLLEG